MKLFRFNPNTYGEEAFVVAESREKAIDALLKSPPDRPDDAHHVAYHDASIKKMAALEDGYTLEEYPVGHVIFSEIS